MTTHNTPLRAGVIGLGAGRFHTTALRAIDGADLAAICDIDTQRLAAFGAEFDVPISGHYTDYRQMFAEADLDLVCIALPNALHEDAALAAMRAGLHVVVEKPMTTGVASAERIAAAEASGDRRLMVVYQRRYRADTHWIKQQVDAGRLGHIYHVSAAWRRETGIPGRGWFGTKTMAGGGPLIDLGVHVIDLALYVLGYPQVLSVTGQTWRAFGDRGLKVWGPRGTQMPDFDVEDNAVGFLRLSGGTALSVQASWAEHTAPRADYIAVEFQGTEGSIRLDIPKYTREDTVRYFTEIDGEAVTVRPEIRWHSNVHYEHADFLTQAVAAIRDGAPAPSSAAEGLVMARILEGLYRSAELGREITLEPVELGAE